MAARRKYPRTPAQRAALRRAQLISAQRRRRARFKNGARVVGTVLAATAAYGVQSHLNRYAGDWRAAQRDINSAKGAISKFRAKKTVVSVVHAAQPRAVSRRSVRYAMGSGKRVRR